MMFTRVAYAALAGALLASLGASEAAAATQYWCWKSNGKTVCVKKTSSTSTPPNCKTQPCAVVSSGQGGNNRPVVEMPAKGVTFAPKDDIRVGLGQKLDATRFAASAAMAPAKATPTALQPTH